MVSRSSVGLGKNVSAVQHFMRLRLLTVNFARSELVQVPIARRTKFNKRILLP
ncbi:hypothetical protein HanRHA438_Chr10g0461231 [Helianthus annuus]|nr:hypothetical protein HanRHA438_Chr10g0461231 [Helianthus annuus]